MKPEPLREFVFTAHAESEMLGRGLSKEDVSAVLASPETRMAVRPGRDVFQSRYAHEGKTYLIRVFVDIDRKPGEVVTAYRTSKISKYQGNP